MRTIKPYEVWLPPLRSSRLRNAPPPTLPGCISQIGGGE